MVEPLWAVCLAVKESRSENRFEDRKGKEDLHFLAEEAAATVCTEALTVVITTAETDMVMMIETGRREEVSDKSLEGGRRRYERMKDKQLRGVSYR